MNLDLIKSRANGLINLADELINHDKKTVASAIVWEGYREFYASSLSFLTQIFGESHSFTQFFKKIPAGSTTSLLMHGRAVMKSAKQEIDGGWLNSLKSLLSAEIFSDFLEMAVHLLEQGFKDSAAVMTGSVLEEHLRHLCQANSLPIDTQKDGKLIPKKADTMNAELAKAAVYNALSQKSVTAWLDLRNKAAHGKYGEYTIEEVRLMQQGVTDFIARTT